MTERRAGPGGAWAGEGLSVTLSLFPLQNRLLSSVGASSAPSTPWSPPRTLHQVSGGHSAPFAQAGTLSPSSHNVVVGKLVEASCEVGVAVCEDWAVHTDRKAREGQGGPNLQVSGPPG